MMDILTELIQARRTIHIYVPAKERFGVAVFCEELQAALTSSGVHAILRKATYWQVAKAVWHDRRNGCFSVLSLAHGSLSFLNRRGTVFLLHGFPNLSDYSAARFLAVIAACKIAAANAKFVVSNSQLTAALNSKLFRIPSHGIWNPLRAYPLDARRPFDSAGRSRTVLFCGRAIAGKRVYEALQSFLSIDDRRGWSFCIAGPVLDPRLDQHRMHFEHRGTLARGEIQSLMSTSAIFISLNELEPYGLTIQEAAQAGMLLVCTESSGAARELVRLQQEQLFLVEAPDIQEVSRQLNSAMRFFERHENT